MAMVTESQIVASFINRRREGERDAEREKRNRTREKEKGMHIWTNMPLRMNESKIKRSVVSLTHCPP